MSMYLSPRAPLYINFINHMSTPWPTVKGFKPLPHSYPWSTASVKKSSSYDLNSDFV